MTDERWQEVLGHIKDNFQVLTLETHDLPEEDGRGVIEIVEFIGPVGKMKLERTSQPLVTDKRTIGSKRIGSQTTVEYIYSPTEKVHKLKAFRWSDSDSGWVEVTMGPREMIF